MRIKTNIVKLLAVLVILGSLVAIAAVPAFAATATLTPIQGTVGSPVSVNASGFAPSTVLTVRFDGAAVTTAPSTITTNTSGAATFAVSVPVTSAGTHVITVTDGVNSQDASFTVQPKVVVTSPASMSGPVGTSVTVSGTGFSGAIVTANVMIGVVPLVSNVPVDATGSFTATGVVPALTSGVKAITAADGAGNPSVVNGTFTVTPTLLLNPNTGLPGATVAIVGSGWTAGPVDITFEGTLRATVTAGTSGSINTTFPIPTTTAGVKAVVGNQTAVTATTTFTVTSRLLSVSPSTGAAGTQVVITGTSLTPGPAGNIPIGGLTLNGVALNTSVITIDSTGTMSPVTVRLAGATLGTNIVRVVDSGPREAVGVFTETASTLSVSPPVGPKGTMVTFNGAGFVPGIQVTVTLAGATVSSVPDSTGRFAAGLSTSDTTTLAVGPNTAVATDAYSNTGSATFTVPPPAITVTPEVGSAGTTVTVAGTGFAGYSAVAVSLGGVPYFAQPLTDPLGAFSATITVPALAPGASTVSVVVAGITATKFFTISSAPPTAASALATISTNLVRVWGYSGGTWSMYDPADAAGSNLASLTSGAGYWINANAACTLVYVGYSYALSTGWNLIGWR